MKKRGMRARKAQVTLFILIAIVLIAGAVSYIYLSRQKTGTDLMNQAKKEAELITQSDSLRMYVESCLQQATEEAVLLVGSQGGYIYDYQSKKGVFFLGPGGSMCNTDPPSFPPGTCDPGANIIPLSKSGVTNNVSFLIRSNPSPVFPLYPYWGYLRTKDPADTFGMAVGGEKKGNPLELCDVDGPNAQDAEGAKYTCFNSYSSMHKSIQSFLSGYISEKVQKCVDFSNVAVSKGAKIEADNATAEVMLGETDLISTIHYRLQITSNTNPSVTTLADFNYRMDDMRLKEIYELVYYIVKEDTTNIFFDKFAKQDLMGLAGCMNPASQALKTPCLKEGMNVTRINNPCIGCPKNRYADIIQITDNSSSIEGEKYIFQFAVANRPPALDNIGLEIPDTAHYYRYLTANGKGSQIYHKRHLVDNSDGNYSIIVGKSDTLEIYPFGIDPDENPLSYRYVPITPDTLTSQKLEGSDLFHTTSRDALISASELGVGEHYVRVTISDEEGLADWQDLRILLCDVVTEPLPDPLPAHACK